MAPPFSPGMMLSLEVSGWTAVPGVMAGETSRAETKPYTCVTQRHFLKTLSGSPTAKAFCILAQEGTAPCSSMLEWREQKAALEHGTDYTLILMPLHTSCTAKSRTNLYLICSKTHNWE